MDSSALHNDPPIVIIGAGVIGLSIAFRLARVYPNVVLIDRGEPGMACSYGNAGHIATEQVFPLASPATLIKAPRLMLGKNRPLSVRREYARHILPWLTRFAWASRPSAFKRGTEALSSLQMAAMTSLTTLCADAGVPEQLQQRGHLVLVESPQLAAAAKAQLQSMAQHGIAADWLDTPQVAEIAPELTSNIGAIRVHNSGHVTDPLKLSRGLLEAFIQAGGRVLRDEVQNINRRADGDVQLQLSSSELAAQRVVIAAGAWSRTLAAQTGFDVPLDTERGYHVVANGWRGKFDIAIASLDRMTIMTPLQGGLRITGFVEFGGLELPPSPARLATLNRHLSELLPDSDMPARSEWMGFRPSLPDHLPVIGRCPDSAKLFYAFGHQHLGLTLAGVTADAVASLMSGTRPEIDLSPFRIDRF
ncbi:NAD(P)/FAD-dependent oxidoreductase [Congregibacter sp.]|jgi:glycine/D-amino acid oxidase-like deaminating enzyme|uniref:NAD(P)/FAD-dependent oxidoreductase n=1 Tax=Congregibacter sp. TaxID=2744308 RepID=UPI0039E49D52